MSCRDLTNLHRLVSGRADGQNQCIQRNTPGGYAVADKGDIEERVKKVIRELTGDKTLVIESDSALVDDLGLDSVDFASLVMDLEDEFGGEVNDEEAVKLARVSEIVDYIAAREQ